MIMQSKVRKLIGYDDLYSKVGQPEWEKTQTVDPLFSYLFIAVKTLMSHLTYIFS